MNKFKNSKEGIITFPVLQCWNPHSQTATIAAQVSGNRVLCNISMDVLKRKYHIFSDEPMKAITAHRSEIETAARKIITRKNFDKCGSIDIQYEDL